jgi:hypothetical protein
MDPAAAARYIEELCQREAALPLGEDFFITSGITAEMLDTAKKSYANGLTDTECPLLLHITKGSKKDGCLLTNRCFYCSQPSGKPMAIPTDQIAGILDTKKAGILRFLKVFSQSGVVAETQIVVITKTKKLEQIMAALVRILTEALGCEQGQPTPVSRPLPKICRMEQADAMKYMEEVYAREDGHLLGTRFHITSAIPAQKLDNAKKNYAKDLGSDEYPLMLHDNAVTKNGKAGFLLTNRVFYCSRTVQKPMAIPLEQILQFSYNEGGIMVQTSTEVVRTPKIDRVELELTETIAQSMERLFRILSEVLELSV